MLYVYILGALLGTLGGCIALLFSENGWRGLIITKCNPFRSPEHRVQRIVLVVCGGVIGLYNTWLYKAFNLNSVGHLLLSVYLLSATPNDIRNHEIHSDLLIAFSVAGVIYNIMWLDAKIIINSIVGALVGFAVLGLPFLLRKGSVGMGDLLLSAICGLFCGFPEIIYLLIRALIIMAIWGIIQLIRKRAIATTELPLAPFLLIATLL